MLIPIKQIITENKFFDNISNGQKNFDYNEEKIKKDKNVLGFAGKVGVPAGMVVGGLADAVYDGNEYNLDGSVANPELTGNGAVIGGIIGGLGTAGYGLNNNHKIIC